MLHEFLSSNREELIRRCRSKVRAVKAFDALKVGNIGLRGATGALLEESLAKLRALI